LIKLVLFSFLVGFVCADDRDAIPEVQEEENVLILTNDNFDAVVTENQHVLVEFYAPWCGHCKALAPEYAKAATSLKEEGSAVKLAKVDATVQSELGSRFKVQGYPTLKFFKGGKALEYGGGRQAADIVSWLKKKTGPPTVPLTTADEAQKFKDDNEVLVVGFFPVNEEALTKFVKENQLRLVTEFTSETAPKIFGGDIQVHNLLFISKLNVESDGHLDAFTEAAKSFKGKVLFIYIDTDQEDNKRVMEFFGLAESDIPSYRIIKMSENMAKFKPDSPDLTTEAISAFTSKVVDGKVDRHLMSAELPEDWNKNPVTVLVGSNFQDVAYDKKKKVFVEFYAPWCGHCKSLAPIWEKLGEKYTDADDVVVAKMDSTANELSLFEISGFPTLKFFPAQRVIDYDGDRTVDAMAAFIDSNGEKVSESEGDGELEEVDEVGYRDI
uniref:protein disulfide-isomerase n=1 Tax=Ciona savignyi TaxID=51511 RepID=H2ZN97_CIOSA